MPWGEGRESFGRRAGHARRGRSEAGFEFLRALRAAIIATDGEVLACIERNHLYDTGLGYTDVHLLASAMRLQVLVGEVEGVCR